LKNAESLRKNWEQDRKKLYGMIKLEREKNKLTLYQSQELKEINKKLLNLE
jgi:hypothetical protein